MLAPAHTTRSEAHLGNAIDAQQGGSKALGRVQNTQWLEGHKRANLACDHSYWYIVHGWQDA